MVKTRTNAGAVRVGSYLSVEPARSTVVYTYRRDAWTTFCPIIIFVFYDIWGGEYSSVENWANSVYLFFLAISAGKYLVYIENEILLLSAQLKYWADFADLFFKIGQPLEYLISA
jgi:hypothetical protein